jgi:hypothetical protein
LDVVVALAAPLNVTVAPPPPVLGLKLPDTLYVNAVAVKLTLVTLALLTVTDWFAGLKEVPALLGVIV